ncbi:hypothetical protein ABZ863_25235 [Saccharomonospora sp. NPDC046836]
MSQAYLPRLIDDLLARRLAHHPAVLLVGPRATGKPPLRRGWCAAS